MMRPTWNRGVLIPGLLGILVPVALVVFVAWMQTGLAEAVVFFVLFVLLCREFGQAIGSWSEGSAPPAPRGLHLSLSMPMVRNVRKALALLIVGGGGAFLVWIGLQDESFDHFTLIATLSLFLAVACFHAMLLRSERILDSLCALEDSQKTAMRSQGMMNESRQAESS